MRDGFLYFFLLRMVRRLPMLLLVLGGSAFAVVRWRRHPRSSLMTLLALLIYLIEGMLFLAFLYWIPDLTFAMKLSPKVSGWLYTLIFFFEDFVFALVIILLVGAAYTGRKGITDSAPPPPEKFA
ncbi:MAG: hypothetical protein AABM67_19225 [Acidobacteriota bacterium]